MENNNLIPFYVTYNIEDTTHTVNTPHVCILLAESESDALSQAGHFIRARLKSGFATRFYAKEFKSTDIVMAEREDMQIYNTLRGINVRICFSYDNDYY